MEDFALLADNKDRLTGVEFLADSFSFSEALPVLGSGDLLVALLVALLVPSIAPVPFFILDFVAASWDFLDRIVVLPKSADLRVSFCRSAVLKKDNPLSSDLLFLRRSVFEETLGDRKLVTEELLLELLTGLRSTRTLSLPVTSKDLAELLVLATPGFSARGLMQEDSLLRLLSDSFFLPADGVEELLSVAVEVFFPAGDGEED